MREVRYEWLGTYQYEIEMKLGPMNCTDIMTLGIPLYGVRPHDILI